MLPKPLSVSLHIEEFNKLASIKADGKPFRYWFGGSYAFAVGGAMAYCSRCLNESEHADEPVAYVFENHPSQGDANTFWNMLSKPQNAQQKRNLHYASHTFVDGKGPLGSVLQLCDMLAWNINKMEREKKKTKELNHLFRTRTYYRHYDSEMIAQSISMSLDRWNKFDRNGRPYPVAH